VLTTLTLRKKLLITLRDTKEKRKKERK